MTDENEGNQHYAVLDVEYSRRQRIHLIYRGNAIVWSGRTMKKGLEWCAREGVVSVDIVDFVPVSGRPEATIFTIHVNKMR